MLENFSSLIERDDQKTLTGAAWGGRRAKLEKIPYILVVGDDDVAARTLGVNARGSNDPERGVALEAFRTRLRDEIASHASPEGS